MLILVHFLILSNVVVRHKSGFKYFFVFIFQKYSVQNHKYSSKKDSIEERNLKVEKKIIIVRILRIHDESEYN